MVPPDESPSAPAQGARTAVRVGALALVASLGTLGAFAWMEMNPPGSAQAALDVIRDAGARLLGQAPDPVGAPVRPVVVRPADGPAARPALAPAPTVETVAAKAAPAPPVPEPRATASLAAEREMQSTIAERCDRLRKRADELARTGRTEQAIGIYEEILALDARHASAHYGLVLAFVRAGRPQEAREHLTALRDIDPSLASLAANVVR